MYVYTYICIYIYIHICIYIPMSPAANEDTASRLGPRSAQAEFLGSPHVHVVISNRDYCPILGNSCFVLKINVVC